MAKRFNGQPVFFSPTTTTPNIEPDTVNKSGGKAYKQQDEVAFASLVLSNLLKDNSSHTVQEQIDKIRNSKVSAEFMAKTALYARKEHGMRTMPQLVAGFLITKDDAKNVEWTKRFYEAIVERPDDILEIISVFNQFIGNDLKTKLVIPNPMKRGFRNVLSNLDDYKIAKYRGESGAVKMIDVVNLIHPKATPALKKLVDGTAKNVDTWESKISEAGKSDNVESAKAEAWEELISNNKLGWMAILRNLRNIANTSPNSLSKALNFLIEPKRVRKSGIFPFQVLKAYEVLSEIENKALRNQIEVALNKVFEVSIHNIPKLQGRTLIALDDSGSMKSNNVWDIGKVFASFLYKALNSPVYDVDFLELQSLSYADFIQFSDNARKFEYSSNSLTTDLIKDIDKNFRNNSTDFSTIFKVIGNEKYDRIIIISDNEAWKAPQVTQHYFEQYKKRTGVHPVMYTIDLTGSGTSQFKDDKLIELVGYSDKIFDLMNILEQDRNVLVNKINSITF